MKSTKRGIVAALVLCTVLLSVQAALGLPTTYLDKINTTPDYTQTDPAYGAFPDENGVNHGGVFCGPCAASNSVMWLSDQGYTNLAPPTADRKRDQHDMIEVIASDPYMDAYEENGTNPTRLGNGLMGYINDCGYGSQIERLEWQGWRYVPSQYDTGVDIPEFDWMKEGIFGANTVQIWSVGWYNIHEHPTDPDIDIYTRDGGHWVTMVGYDDDEFVIHDPTSRGNPSGTYPEYSHYVTATPLTRESYKNSDTGVELTGQYLLESDDSQGDAPWIINGVGQFAILDGVYVLEMESIENRAPIINEESYTIEMNQTLVADGDLIKGVLDNDYDLDGDDIDVYYHHPTSTGVVNMNTETGNFTFTPREDFVGDTWFWYRIVDEQGLRSKYSIARISVLATGEANAVPEPSMLAMMSILALGLLRFRRR